MKAVEAPDSVVDRADHIAMLRREVAQAAVACERLTRALEAFGRGLSKPAGTRRVSVYAPDMYLEVNRVVGEIGKARSNVLEMLHWTEHWHPFTGPWGSQSTRDPC